MPGPSEAERLTQATLAQRLADVGFVLPGSLITRRMRCGKLNCHCHSEPPELHGPYFQWAHSAERKTLTCLLTEELVERYRSWFDNTRALRQTLNELEALSVAIVERDRRQRS